MVVNKGKYGPHSHRHNGVHLVTMVLLMILLRKIIALSVSFDPLGSSSGGVVHNLGAELVEEVDLEYRYSSSSSSRMTTPDRPSRNRNSVPHYVVVPSSERD